MTKQMRLQGWREYEDLIECCDKMIEIGEDNIKDIQ